MMLPLGAKAPPQTQSGYAHSWKQAQSANYCKCLRPVHHCKQLYLQAAVLANSCTCKQLHHTLPWKQLHSAHPCKQMYATHPASPAFLQVPAPCTTLHVSMCISARPLRNSFFKCLVTTTLGLLQATNLYFLKSCPFVCRSVCLSVFLSFCLSVGLCVCLLGHTTTTKNNTKCLKMSFSLSDKVVEED